MIESLLGAIDVLARESIGRPAVAFPVYILAGLAGSTFPCVYPLVPITAGFIKHRAQPGEGRWKHPTLYWGGMILAYVILGLLAAAGGGAFNALMQSGPVIAFTGFVFLFLTTVMLDWHPLTWQTGDRVLTVAGRHRGPAFTAAMGFVAGLIASACTAPALVAMLLFIAQQSTGSVGWVLYGGALSGSFGLGIGTPFFLVGVVGAHIPKQGRWMSVIKYAFALLVLLAAAYQIEKGFRVMGFSTIDIAGVGAGVLLLALAVVLWAKSTDGSAPARVRQFFALTSVAFGMSLIIRAAAFPGHPEQSTPVSGTLDESSVQKEAVGRLTFFRDSSFAFKKARALGLPIFIDFYADWCANCKDFSRLTGTDKALEEALATSILIKIYDTDKEFSKYQNDTRFPELKIGLPFFLVFSPGGEYLWKTYNYRDTKGMIGALASARKPAGPAADHATKVK